MGMIQRLRLRLATIFAVADRAWGWRPTLVFLYLFGFVWWSAHFGHYAQDFTVFYAAGTPGPVYDARWLTSLQIGLPGPRPFAYPPSFLLVLRPLAQLPYEVALSLWAAASGVLFVEATSRLLPRLPWLVLGAPVCAWAAANGQTSLLLGALVVFGMTLPRRPILAGLLFGTAFSIKPSVLLLLPLALLVYRQWRTLIAMGATGLAICAASLIFGPELWINWIKSFDQFQAMNQLLHVRTLAAPFGLWWAAIIGAVLAVWFSASRDAPTRLVAVLGGSLLVSPHAVPYEMAMLAPATLGLIASLQRRSLAAVVVFFTLIMPGWGLAVYLTVTTIPAFARPIWTRFLGVSTPSLQPTAG